MTKKFNVIGLFICLFCVASVAAMNNCSQQTKDFMQAVEDKDFQKADLLLQQGADINGCEIFGWTALSWAAQKGDLADVQYLVGKGADKEAVSGMLKETPLHKAASNDRLDIVKYLVEQGANKDARNKYKETPIYIAAQNGHLNVVKYLVEQGVNVTINDESGRTLLHIAAQNGHLNIVKYLVEQGANKDAVDKYQETPVYCAARSGSLDVVTYLVKQGANVTIKDEDEKTPLQIAEENGKTAVVNYLNSVTSSMRTYYRAKALIKNNWGKIAIVSGLGLGLFATVLRWWYARHTGVSFIPKITWFNRKNSQQIQVLAPKSFVPVNRL